MASYNYADFRHSLRFHGFAIEREGPNHEIWRKVTSNGSVYQVPVRRKFHETIPKGLFHSMLSQAHLTEDEFRQGL